MPLTKQYLRYVPGPVFDVIASPACKACFVSDELIATGACEDVILWNLRLGQKVTTFHAEDAPVATIVLPTPNTKYLAVGYVDGTIRVFDTKSGECSAVYSGHKINRAVTALAFDATGTRLFSGSQDTTIIAMDVVNECGLFKLHGHKEAVTQIKLVELHDVLVTSSRDCTVKFWDLDSRHCVRTITKHRSEVWDFVLMKNDSYLITGSSDSSLRVWRMEFPEMHSAPEVREKNDAEIEDDEENEHVKLTYCGDILRTGTKRVSSMARDKTGRVLACHGPDRSVELFWFGTDAEVKKRVEKRAKKAAAKALKTGEEAENVQLSLTDEVRRLTRVRCTATTKNIDVLLKGDNIEILVTLSNNSVEKYSVAPDKGAEPDLMVTLDASGHRSRAAAVCFSEDERNIVSASSDSLKVWDAFSQQCIRTLECGKATCCIMATSNRHVIVGTKSGELQVFDISSAEMLEQYDAHEGGVDSICETPDQSGIVSGGADSTVKFWSYEIKPQRAIGLILKNTLQVDDQVNVVRVTPNSMYLAAVQINLKVNLYYFDTLKFKLPLYGHKLPIRAADFSSDSTMMAIGGEERKIWIFTLTHGEALGHVFGHDDTVTGIQFLQNTHMFFSCGRDGAVKQWDADIRKKIVTLKGHYGHVTALCVGPSGRQVVSAGADLSLRLWKRTEEPLVLEDEEEEERTKQADLDELAANQDDEKDTEMDKSTRKTLESEKAADRLMGSLDVYKEYMEQIATTTKELPLPVEMQALGATSPHLFMLEVLKKIRSSELDETLLVLPFDYVEQLMQVLLSLLRKKWDVEFIVRCVDLLARVNHGQITTSSKILPVLEELRKVARECVEEARDTVSFNLAGLTYLRRQMEERDSVLFFEDLAQQSKKSRKRKRQQIEAPILML